MPLPFMSRSDKRAWADARDFRDLGQLTADWLEGRISHHPAYGDRSELDHEETGKLIPVLAACNRGGYLTTNSQPGEDAMARGSRWQQRAAVVGFIHDRKLLTRVTQAASKAGLTVVDYAPGDRNQGRIPTTMQNGRPVGGFGSATRRVDLDAQWEDVGRPAYRELAAAHEVTLIDPQWGPSDRLWRVLRQAVR